jgi:cytochrome c556
MRLGLSAIALGGLLALAVGTAGVAADDAAGLVQKRIDLMKENGTHLKPFVDYTKGGPYSDKLVGEAQAIAANAKLITPLFPPNSITDKSRAKPEIWQKWDDFEAKAKELGDAATKLAEAAKKDDVAAVGAALKAVGGACGACHEPYRGPEKK